MTKPVQPQSLCGDKVARLREIIEQKSVERNPSSKILSTVGTQQRWLIDLRKTFFDPVGLDLVTDLFWEHFAGRLPFQVGGLEVGAVPLISAIQLKGLQRGTPVNGFVVRKERKHYGMTKTYEGVLTDDPVVIVDDLINSGGTQEKVRAVLEENGRSIRELFVVIDYESKQGRDWIARHGVQLTSIFKLPEFKLALNRPEKPRGFDYSQFKVIWRFPTPEPNYFDIVPKSTPVLDDKHVYFGADNGELWALDQESGDARWRFPARNYGRKQIWSSPAVHDGRVYFGGYNGNVYCLDGASGKEIWQFTGADWVGSSPAIAPELNLLFIGLEHAVPGRGGSLAAIDLETGVKVWEYAVNNYLHGSPAYNPEKQLVCIGTNDNELLLFDPKTRALRWKFTAGAPIKYAPAFDLDRNAVIAGSFDGAIYIVDLDTGREVWKVATDNLIYSTPLVAGTHAYVTSTDKFFYALDLERRQVADKVYSNAKIYASPRLIEGRVYFATTEGAVFEFDPELREVTGRVQLPDRITNAITYSPHTGLFYAMTYDTRLYAFRRVPAAIDKIAQGARP